jgi:flagellar motor switch/type III secretory pathway protein FliN
MAQSRSVHFMFVSAEIVREILDAERLEAEHRAAAAEAAALQAEQDRADSVARQQEAERQRRAQVEADAAATKAAAEEARIKAMQAVEVDVQATLPEPKFRPGDLVLLAPGSTLTDEQLENGCLRPEIRDGSIVTSAVVAKVSSVSNPWDIPQRLQRQLVTRRATLVELTRENLLSATHSVKEEIDVLETELREMLTLIAVDGKSVVYAVDASAGRRGWYREEQLAKATRLQAEESRKREKEAEEKAMDLLGFISMSGTSQGGSLHGEAHAELGRLGMVRVLSPLLATALCSATSCSCMSFAYVDCYKLLLILPLGDDVAGHTGIFFELKCAKAQ